MLQRNCVGFLFDLVLARRANLTFAFFSPDQFVLSCRALSWLFIRNRYSSRCSRRRDRNSCRIVVPSSIHDNRDNMVANAGDPFPVCAVVCATT